MPCLDFAVTGAAAPVLGAVVSLQIATLFWVGLRRDFAGRQFFLLALGAAIWWSVGGIAELLSSTQQCKIFWGELTWIGIGLLPPAWLGFVLRFSAGSTEAMSRKEVLFIVGTAFATSSLALSNATHHLFYLDAVLVPGPQGAAVIRYIHGPLFYLAAAVLYGMMIAAFLRLFSCALSASHLYRKHYILLAAASAVPLAGNMAYVAFGFTIFGLDPTPYLFTLPCLLLIVLVASGEFFDFYSLGQKLIVENMKTPAILFAGDGRIFPLNGSARKLVDAGETGGSPLLDPGMLQLMRADAGGTELKVAAGNRYLSMETIPVPEARAPMHSDVGAKVVLLHDVTLEYRRALDLERSVSEQAESIRLIQKNHDLYLEQATRDPLTGLLNRRSLDDCYSRMAEQAGARDAPVTIAMVDLDGFKGINDRWGHANGDRALVTFADALRAMCREEDQIFRLGGDEFLVLTVSMPEEVLETRLREMGEGPGFQPDAGVPDEVRVGFSFGTASAPGDASLDQLMAVADRKLYATKSERRHSRRGRPAPPAAPRG